MIIKNTYSEKEDPVFSREIEDIILNTRPQWSNLKEDIWMEMEAKLDAMPIEKKIQPTRSLKPLRYAAVATVALFLSFGLAASLYTKSVETLTTEKSFLLPDNSKVVLHANSSLSYKPILWEISRKTKLDGEAYFEVKSGSKFEVVSEKAKTVVLGTKFLVTARENEYNVHCDHGKVMLIESSVEKNEIIITAGQKARLKENKQFEIISQNQNKPADIAQQTTVTIQENNRTLPEEKPIIAPKAEIISEHSRQEVMQQERAQMQKISQPDVKQNILNSPKEIRLNEIDNLLNEAEAKLQNENQERIHIQNQNQQQEKPNNNAESPQKRFRNSLTQKQLDILEDKTMDRAQKQKAFMHSLTNEQKQLLKEQNAGMEFGKEGVQRNTTIKESMKNEQRGRRSQVVPDNPIEKGGNGPGRGGGAGGKQSPR